ncbi:hypothetical protein ACET3Z_010945 [Daucus carota]
MYNEFLRYSLVPGYVRWPPVIIQKRLFLQQPVRQKEAVIFEDEEDLEEDEDSEQGLNRCRKSCRLRWLNYLRPTIKRGEFGADEVDLMMRLHKLLGNR